MTFSQELNMTSSALFTETRSLSEEFMNIAAPTSHLFSDLQFSPSGAVKDNILKSTFSPLFKATLFLLF